MTWRAREMIRKARAAIRRARATIRRTRAAILIPCLTIRLSQPAILTPRGMIRITRASIRWGVFKGVFNDIVRKSSQNLKKVHFQRKPCAITLPPFASAAADTLAYQHISTFFPLPPLSTLAHFPPIGILAFPSLANSYISPKFATWAGYSKNASTGSSHVTTGYRRFSQKLAARSPWR